MELPLLPRGSSFYLRRLSLARSTAAEVAGKGEAGEWRLAKTDQPQLVSCGRQQVWGNFQISRLRKGVSLQDMKQRRSWRMLRRLSTREACASGKRLIQERSAACCVIKRKEVTQWQPVGRCMKRKKMRFSVSFQIVARSTDFCKRITAQRQEQGCVTLTYICTHCTEDNILCHTNRKDKPCS